MIPDLNTKSDQQLNPTQNTEAEITQFLDYVANNPSTFSNTNLEIWYFILTVMHHTYHNHRYATALEGTTTWACYQLTRKNIQTFRHKEMDQPTRNS